MLWIHATATFLQLIYSIARLKKKREKRRKRDKTPSPAHLPRK
jgi:hypothetical protein